MNSSKYWRLNVHSENILCKYCHHFQFLSIMNHRLESKVNSDFLSLTMGDRVEQTTQKKSGLKRTESAKEPREWEKIREDQSLNQTQPSRLKRTSSGRGLGATGNVPRAATLGPRRGNTPSKTEAPQLPVPRFTAAQKLAILDRLENRNFIRGGGLEQFRDEFNLDGKSKGNACKQNLATAFATLDKPATGTKTGDGNEVEFEQAHWTTVEDNYSELPPYIKIVDKFLVMQYTTHRDLMRLADIKSNKMLTEILPPLKIASFLTKMNKLLSIIQKMMKQPGRDFDMLELFKPEFMVDQNGNTYVLHCDIRERPKVLEAFKKVPQMLERLNQLHDRLQEQKQKPMDCNTKLKEMKEKLDNLEKMLRELNMATKDQIDLMKKTNELKSSCDSSSDSLDGYFDGLSDASSPASLNP
ncbi:hypothetical protein Ocin01_09363 [Orchesella cincta]|uniref:Uncharacterized protein n=1 Tax=Orchesella cincta TaxID=48709 RepID=A0A1D2MW81_ORCCI|nr:hypothetical protein Ocin01_09363 [Orchesella cincta]